MLRILFIGERDVVASRSDYYMLSHIAKLVNEGFFAEGGRIRGVPVTIGGSSYHYLISHGVGFLVIPEKEVPEFKKLLVKYYEGEDISVIATFMKERCWKTIEKGIP